MSRYFNNVIEAVEYAQARANNEGLWFRVERCALDGAWVVHGVPHPDQQFGRDLTDGELISPENQKERK